MRKHQAELLYFFRGRGARPQYAADLAQESWSRLIRYCNVQEPASLRGLLFTIARNVLHNHWRWNGLHQIEQPTDFSSVEVASELPGLERQWQARRSLQTLEAAVEDRKSVGSGKSVSVRVDHGGSRSIKQQQEIE